MIAQWCRNAQSHGWDFIVGGDFNAGYQQSEGTHGDMATWAHQVQLHHTVHEASTRLVTRPHPQNLSTGSQIDHILVSGAFILLKAETDTFFLSQTFSDHFPTCLRNVLLRSSQAWLQQHVILSLTKNTKVYNGGRHRR